MSELQKAVGSINKAISLFVLCIVLVIFYACIKVKVEEKRQAARDEALKQAQTQNSNPQTTTFTIPEK